MVKDGGHAPQLPHGLQVEPGDSTEDPEFPRLQPEAWPFVLRPVVRDSLKRSRPALGSRHVRLVLWPCKEPFQQSPAPQWWQPMHADARRDDFFFLLGRHPADQADFKPCTMGGLHGPKHPGISQ